MGMQQYGQLIASLSTAGTAYNTYTTAKSMLSSTTATEAAAAVATLPANFFQRNGVVMIDFLAGISNRVTGPDTFTINIMVGAVIAFTTGAITLTTTAHTGIPLRGQIILRSNAFGNGTLANVIGSSTMWGQMVQQGGTAAADSATLSNTIIVPNTAPAAGTGFDSTIANTLDFHVAQSVSNAANGFQMFEYTVMSWGNLYI